MIYCISDIHGMENLFDKMLDKINLQQGDTLYVLGDCIDRGGGLGVLRHIMRLQEAGLARFIKGNHEIIFAESIQQYDPDLTLKLIKSYSGAHRRKEGDSIYSAMNRLSSSVKHLEYGNKALPSAQAAGMLSEYRSFYSCNDFFRLSTEEQKKILSFIQESPVYADVVIGKSKFRLTHAGCNPDGSISSDIRREFFTRKTPLDNTTVVFGHTTTKDIRILTDRALEEPAIWYDDHHDRDKIGIDCGAPFERGRLACLRLDDMEEFYVENNAEPADFLKVWNDYARKTGSAVTPDGGKRWYEFLLEWQQVKSNTSPREKGKQINSNIDGLPIPESVKGKLKGYLRMIHNYAELVKTSPTNDTYQKTLLDYAKKVGKLCTQYNIETDAVIY